jgi:hypothetical protein
MCGVLVMALVLGGLIWSAAAGRTSIAEHPGLFGGSLVLEEDSRPLTVVNLATAKVTIRLTGVYNQVGAGVYSDVQTVPVAGGTMLVDGSTGTFNFLEQDNYLLAPNGSGVGLGPLTGETGAEGLAAGSDAYVVRAAPQSTVSLVSQATVAAAAKLQFPAGSNVGPTGSRGGVTAAPAGTVTPPGFSALAGTVSLNPGSATVDGTDLWVLESTGLGCVLEQLHPVPSGHNGLIPTDRGKVGADCSRDALESAAGAVGLLTPGQGRLFLPAARGATPRVLTVSVPATTQDDEIIPVTNPSGQLLYLAHGATGWSLVGIAPTGQVSGPYPLTGLGRTAAPAEPAYANGFLYTLDRDQPAQPTLWTIDAANGNMAPLSGVSTYPAKSRTEEVPFSDAEVIADGPRVVFNNPGSIDAVVVFTDGTRPPAVIDKSDAVQVSATGPAGLSGSPTSTNSPGSRGSTTPTSRPETAVQPVSAQVNCASATQKPYAPQISSITPASGSALVAWSYQLLDQTDCEPDSWSVTMTALTGSHQPAQPTQVENGQEQYDFTGLRPATTYRVVVTAYINTQSTQSSPATFTTSPRGPDAPMAVHTTADMDGDWIVSWTPCDETTHPNCVVPADNWTVTGSACGSGFVGQPPSVQVPGGETTVTINSDALGLLGASLSFSVQGSLVSGLSGDPTSDGACTAAWRTPNPSAIQLTDAGTLNGSTITATLKVSTTGSAAEAFGSQATEFVYNVGGILQGPTTSRIATVVGLAAGQQYTPTVTVFPSGHPNASVKIQGNSFVENLPWPTDMGVNVTTSVDQGNPDAGELAISFVNLPPGPMKAAGSYTCGSSAPPNNSVGGTVAADGSVPPAAFTDLVNYGGMCTLTMTLFDPANPNPYGISSPELTAQFSIGTQPNYQFTASISPACQTNYCGPGGPPMQIEVDIQGASASPPLAGQDWTISATDPLHLCDTSVNSADPPFVNSAYLLTLPAVCTPDEASTASVTVSYKYMGVVNSPAASSVGGTPVTTTSTSSSTSTTTTTLPPCPSTTSSSDTSTSTTSTTLPCAPGASTAALRSGPTESTSADPVISDALGGALIGFPILWLAGGARTLVRKRRRS